MARTNVLTTARRIRRQLGLGNRQEQGLLLTAMDSSQATVAFTGAMPNAVQVGATLDIDLEIMRILTINKAANTCTVIRGYLDSDPAAHLVSAYIDIAPRFSLLDIVDAMQSELAAWGQELYYVDANTFSVATTVVSLELPLTWANTLGVIECLQSEVSSSSTVWPRIPLKLIRSVSGAAFTGAPTSGILLRFTEPIRSGSIFVTVALPFGVSVLSPTLDLVTDYHLSLGLIDVLELGCRRRLLSTGDDSRTSRTAQDEPRRAEETQIGTLVPLSQLRMATYVKRKSEEVALLRRLYPIRVA